MLRFHRVAQWPINVDGVMITSSYFGHGDKTGGNEIVHDPVGGTFGDAHPLGDRGKPAVRILGDTDEYMGMVRQKRPCRMLSGIISHKHMLFISRIK